MTNQQKKDYARLLYVKDSLTQEEIALRVGVNSVTISRWKKEESWDALKKSLLTTRQAELANLYDQLSELNKHIRDKPEGQRFANSKEGDVIRKLTASIRELETETSVAQVVDVFIPFNEWARKVDPEQAKKMLDFQDAFIKTLLR